MSDIIREEGEVRAVAMACPDGQVGDCRTVSTLASLPQRAPWRWSGFIALPAHRVVRSLQWWRKRNFAWAARRDMEELRCALSLTLWPGRSDWRAAARGDAVTAIHLALLTLSEPSPSAWCVNLAGSALVLCASNGDPAADLVLDRFRSRFAGPKATSRPGGVN